MIEIFKDDVFIELNDSCAVIYEFNNLENYIKISFLKGILHNQSLLQRHPSYVKATMIRLLLIILSKKVEN
jgi:hypothetical protein